MKLRKVLLKSITLQPKPGSNRFLIIRHFRFSIAISLTLLILAAIHIRGLASAQQVAAREARVMNFEYNHDKFRVFRNRNDRSGNPISNEFILVDDYFVEIPVGRDYWAEFGFFSDSGRVYDNLIVKAFGEGTYTFPCTFADGRSIIAWGGGHTGTRACSDRNNENDRIDLISAAQSSNNYLELLTSRAITGLSTKQDSGGQDSSKLSISPGNEATLIRNNKSDLTTVTYVERCESWQTPNGSGYRCETRPEQSTSESIEIEVFQGDVLIKSDESPGGVQVTEGQKYTYPGGFINRIDVGSAANSCEMLQFLNPGYWTSPNDPVFTETPISEQLRQHREALGVSGRPANLSSLEQGIVDEMNLARTNPRAYAEFLVERRQYFNGNRLELPGEIPLVTREGAAGYNNAISFLRSTRSLPPLTATAGMSQAAKELVAEQSSTGAIGHGSGSNSMISRIQRHGSAGCNNNVAENVAYGSDMARDVVIQLIVEDGQFPKYHRENIFTLDFQVTGVGCDSHPKWRSGCAITYAHGYLEGN